MKISEFKPDFDDVLIKPKRSQTASRKDVKLDRYYKHIFKYSSIVPIINSNMDTVGTFAMAEALIGNKMFGCIHKHYDMEKLKEFYGNAYLEEGKEGRASVFYTMGIKDNEFEKFNKLYTYCSKRNCVMEAVCLDVANGYTQTFTDAVKKLRDMYHSLVIMAGNVATPEITESLILAGADIVKIGIGPGSVCTTRVKTGVGYPQLSAIAECADAAHGLDRYICADGGCRTSGDICKAICAGADMVMLGGMLAGCDECDGEWWHEKMFRYEYVDSNIFPEGYPMGSYRDGYTGIATHDKSKDQQIEKSGNKTYLKYYGMSSKDAAQKYHGGIAEHRTDEGKSVLIPYKGPVSNILQDIEGGLRSCGSYIGAMNIKDFPKCASFIRTNTQENKIFSNV